MLIEQLAHIKTKTKAFQRRSVYSGLFWKPLYWHVKDIKWQSFCVNPQEQTERKLSNRFAHVADVRDGELSKSGGPSLLPLFLVLHYNVLFSVPFWCLHLILDWNPAAALIEEVLPSQSLTLSHNRHEETAPRSK